MVPIDELLGNRKLLQLLLFLADNPSTEWAYTQIRVKTKLAKATLTKWLLFLEKNELVFMKPIGANKLYRVNNDNPVIKQLKVLKTITQLSSITKIAKKYTLDIFLYGSASRGEDAEKSDIDLLIIGKIKKEEIMTEIHSCSQKIRKEIRLQVFTSLEWSKLVQKDPAFYER